MNTHKLKFRNKFFGHAVLGLFLLLSMVLISGAANTLPPVEKVTFLYERVLVLDRGRVWTDESGTHIRNRVDLGLLSGDIHGNAIVVFNADLPAVLNIDESERPEPEFGAAYGEIQIFTHRSKSISPTWEGTWEYKLRGEEVVDGSLTASNADETRMVVVDAVRQVRPGVLEHSGTIEHLYCLDARCDPILLND